VLPKGLVWFFVAVGCNVYSHLHNINNIHQIAPHHKAHTQRSLRQLSRSVQRLAVQHGNSCIHCCIPQGGAGGTGCCIGGGVLRVVGVGLGGRKRHRNASSNDGSGLEGTPVQLLEKERLHGP
jgi:hypothetical protein